MDQPYDILPLTNDFNFGKLGPIDYARMDFRNRIDDRFFKDLVSAYSMSLDQAVEAMNSTCRDFKEATAKAMRREGGDVLK